MSTKTILKKKLLFLTKSIKKVFEKILRWVRSNKLLIASIIVLVYFHLLFINLLNSIIVEPLLIYFIPNFFTDAIIVIVSIYIIIDGIKKIQKNYILSVRKYGILIITTVFYIYLRGFTNYWEFKGLVLEKKVKYFDLIFVFSLVNTILFLRNKVKIKNQDENDLSPFEFDIPISSIEKDLLDRSKIALGLIKRLPNANGHPTLTIGISGQWGSGKSSFLNLIKSQLDDKNKILIEFNPWKSLSPNKIIPDFFSLLREELNEHSSELTNLLNEYSKDMFSNGDALESRIVNYLKSFIDIPENSSIEFNLINETLKRIKKQFVIFIDDMDRLEFQEIQSVFRLIRNTAHFNNTIFIIAYDKKYLISTLNANSGNDNSNYIEKFFSVEVSLPQFDVNILPSELLNLIQNNLLESNLNEIKNFLIGDDQHKSKLIFNFVKTIRDITRLANSFNLSYQFLKGEIDVIDLIKIECLKLKYEEIYKYVYLNQNKVLSSENKGYLGIDNIVLKTEKENGDTFILEKEITQNNGRFGIAELEVKSVIELLEEIFSKKDVNMNFLSIANPKRFYLYFSYHIFKGSLSEEEFNKFRVLEPSKLLLQIPTWIGLGLRNALINRLKLIREYNSREDYENVIFSIFILSITPRIEAEKHLFSIGYDFADLYKYKLAHKSGSKQILALYDNDKVKYKSFLVSILESATSPYFFESDFIHYIRKELSSDNFILERDELLAIQVNYLSKYLDSVEKFDFMVWSLFRNCEILTFKYPTSSTVSTIISPNYDAIEFLKDFIKTKALDSFIKEIIEKNFELPQYRINKVLIEIYKSYEAFEAILWTSDKSRFKYADEFLLFMHEARSKGYTNFIEFEFKVISV